MISFDSAASTPMDPRVARVMRHVQPHAWANPSSLHRAGVESQSFLSRARKQVAECIGAHEDEVLFTSGGTESNTLALRGVIEACADACPHVVSTAIEHSSVLELLQRLERQKRITLTLLPVDAQGCVRPDDLFRAISPDSRLVSIMAVNNELGSIQPVAECGRMVLRVRRMNGSQYPLFHVDACQALGWLDIAVEKWHADLLSLSGSKAYGPKGTGVLFVRRMIGTQSHHVPFAPLFLGGGQERGLRSGTEDVVSATGFAEACRTAVSRREAEMIRMRKLQQQARMELAQIQGVRLHGDEVQTIPSFLHVSIMGIEGEAMQLYLDAHGFAVSTGAACSSRSETGSHVLVALGLSQEECDGAIRITMGRWTRSRHLRRLIQAINSIIPMLSIMRQTDLEQQSRQSKMNSSQ